MITLRAPLLCAETGSTGACRENMEAAVCATLMHCESVCPMEHVQLADYLLHHQGQVHASIQPIAE